MKYVGYYNGEIGPLEEMKIPMLDRGGGWLYHGSARPDRVPQEP